MVNQTIHIARDRWRHCSHGNAAFLQGTRIGYSSAQTLFDRAPKIMKGTKGDCFALKPTLMACVPVSTSLKTLRVFFFIFFTRILYLSLSQAVMDRIYKAVIQEVNSGSLLFREMFLACYERKRSRYEDGYQSMVLNKWDNSVFLC